MYAVIRTGGKQYRVAPGDVLRVETLSANSTSANPTSESPVSDNQKGQIEFSDVLAVSAEPGSVTPPSSAKVLATVESEGRGDKILVFHYKRKKQYKKLQGHRQNYTQIRINEIQVDGNSYRA